MPLDIVGGGSDAPRKNHGIHAFPASSRAMEAVTPAEWIQKNRALLLRCARAAGISGDIPADVDAHSYVSQVYDGGAVHASNDYLEAGLQVGSLRIPLGRMVGDVGRPKTFEPDRRFLSRGVSPSELAGLKVSLEPLFRPDRVIKLRATVAGRASASLNS
jgi:hypothetical protein